MKGHFFAKLFGNPHASLQAHPYYISYGPLRCFAALASLPVFAIPRRAAHVTSCSYRLVYTSFRSARNGCPPDIPRPAICLSICACKHAHLLSRMAGAYIIKYYRIFPLYVTEALPLTCLYRTISGSFISANRKCVRESSFVRPARISRQASLKSEAICHGIGS